MRSDITDRHLTPSKITAWLDCAAYLDLKHQVEAGLQTAPSGGMGAFARLLADKGLAHEDAVLEEYRSRGLRVVEAPPRRERETFASWAARVAAALDQDDWDVLCQTPMVHAGIRGVADFLLRGVAGDGSVSIEPLDAKLARQDAKPGHVLQLAFYAEAIEAATGVKPERMHLWLGSGNVESLLVTDFDAYWARLRAGLARVLDLDVVIGAAVPEKCAHCAFCEFADVCDARWRAEDSLQFVAGLRGDDRTALEAAGLTTLDALADRKDAVAGMSEQRLTRFTTQADLQRQAREQQPEEVPPFVLVPAGPDPIFGRGLALLPQDDDGDVFLDFEGHPFWRADAGLFFLFGLIELNPWGSWAYRSWWAHDEQQEAAITEALVEYLAERRAEHPGMHVYHYNHTERSSLERLAEGHGVAQVALAELVETGAFVDLLPVVKSSLQLGAESYGLKAVEQLTGYERGHEVDAGSGAVLEYERWMQEGAHDALAAIAAYNEDDVRATRAVRDWLLEHRTADLPWRPAVLEREEQLPELDARVDQLHAFGPGTPESLLGDVLGYWRREWKAYLAPRLAACDGDRDAVLEDPSLLGGLELVGEVERLGAKGRVLTPGMLFRFPPQESSGIDKSVLFPVVDAPPAYASVCRIDAGAGELELLWSEKLAERGVLPTVVAANDWVATAPKPGALSELADAVLDPASEASPVALALSAVICRASCPATARREAYSPTASTTCSPGPRRWTAPVWRCRARLVLARRTAAQDRSARCCARASASALRPSATPPSTTSSTPWSTSTATSTSWTTCTR